MLNYVVLLNPMFTPHSNLFCAPNETVHRFGVRLLPFILDISTLLAPLLYKEPYVCQSWTTSCCLTWFNDFLPPSADAKKKFENWCAFYMTLGLYVLSQEYDISFALMTYHLRSFVFLRQHGETNFVCMENISFASHSNNFGCFCKILKIMQNANIATSLDRSLIVVGSCMENPLVHPILPKHLMLIHLLLLNYQLIYLVWVQQYTKTLLNGVRNTNWLCELSIMLGVGASILLKPYLMIKLITIKLAWLLKDA